MQKALLTFSKPSILPSLRLYSCSLAEQGIKPSYGDLQENTLFAYFDHREKWYVDTGRLFEQIGKWPQ